MLLCEQFEQLNSVNNVNSENNINRVYNVNAVNSVNIVHSVQAVYSAVYLRLYFLIIGSKSDHPSVWLSMVQEFAQKQGS